MSEFLKQLEAEKLSMSQTRQKIATMLQEAETEATRLRSIADEAVRKLNESKATWETWIPWVEQRLKEKEL